MTRAVRIGLGSGSLHREIQSAGHRIIQTGGTLQFGNVRIANRSLYLKRQVVGETSFLQRRRSIHMNVRATLFNYAVMYGNVRRGILHVAGKLIDMNAPRLCRCLWRRRRRRWHGSVRLGGNADAPVPALLRAQRL